jgi:crossover junction endodeoxyribonuclease RuvC
MPRILGIDPGLNITGYGIIEVGSAVSVVEAGVIRTRRKSLAERVHEIHQGVGEVIEAFRPESLALEELYSHYKRPRTAILMGHARGVICLAAASHSIEVFPYAATKIKKMLTGSGRASKAQVQRAIQREFQLTAVPDPPDVADALAIALCHYYSRRRPMRNLGGPHGTFPLPFPSSPSPLPDQGVY